MERNGNGHTVVTIEALSLAGLGSRESVTTKTWLVIGPTAVGVTVTVTVAELPLLMLPRAPTPTKY